MKKGRPGFLLTALATPEAAEAVAETLLRHATTFGLRRRSERRQVLSRRHLLVRTPYGVLRIKQGFLRGRLVQASPEFEDCAEAARRAGVPIREVYAAALAAREE